MADDPKPGFMEMLGNIFKKKEDDKAKKNATDKIKSATESKNDQLNDLYSWGKGGN